MKIAHVGLLLLICCIGLLLFTAFRGLAFPDEGYILSTAQRISSGQLLYKDFDFVYTPLTAFATTLSFYFFGTSILSVRIVSLLLSLLTCYFLLRVTRLITPNTFLQLLPVVMYIAWGPSHTNFIWPGMWAINFSIIANCLLFEGIQKKKVVLSILSGVFFACIILTKQNYAAAVFFEIITLFFFYKEFRRKKIFFSVVIGLGFPLLIFLFFLLSTQSLPAFITSFYSNIIDQIVVRGSINTPLPYATNPLITILKLLFYFSPVILTFFSLLVFWQKKKEYLPLLLMVLFFFLLGFRPVSDYVHLTPLLALSGIPLFLLVSNRGVISGPSNKSSRSSSPNKVILRAFVRTTLYGTVFILSGLGFYSALFFGYYRWSPPLITQNTFITSPRVSIWVDSQTKEKITTITTLVDKYTKPNEEVFLNYYAPMVYFITNRQNPTRYDYTGLSSESQRDLVSTLERKHIRTIVTFSLNKNDQSAIGRYLKKNFTEKEAVDEYTLLQRK